jgi:hypothetical protein
MIKLWPNFKRNSFRPGRSGYEIIGGNPKYKTCYTKQYRVQNNTALPGEEARVLELSIT